MKQSYIKPTHADVMNHLESAVPSYVGQHETSPRHYRCRNSTRCWRSFRRGDPPDRHRRRSSCHSRPWCSMARQNYPPTSQLPSPCKHTPQTFQPRLNTIQRLPGCHTPNGRGGQMQQQKQLQVEMGRYQFFKIDTISIFVTENIGDTDISAIISIF